MHLVEKGDCHGDETLKRLQPPYFVIPQSAGGGSLVEFKGKRLNQILIANQNYAKTLTLAALIRNHTLFLNI